MRHLGQIHRRLARDPETERAHCPVCLYWKPRELFTAKGDLATEARAEWGGLPCDDCMERQVTRCDGCQRVEQRRYLSDDLCEECALAAADHARSLLGLRF